jgi:hypothetical protein
VICIVVGGAFLGLECKSRFAVPQAVLRPMLYSKNVEVDYFPICHHKSFASIKGFDFTWSCRSIYRGFVLRLFGPEPRAKHLTAFFCDGIMSL